MTTLTADEFQAVLKRFADAVGTPCSRSEPPTDSLKSQLQLHGMTKKRKIYMNRLLAREDCDRRNARTRTKPYRVKELASGHFVIVNKNRETGKAEPENTA